MAKREFMTRIITKYLITAAIIVVASEIAKRSDKLGTIVVALPIVTIMAMICVVGAQFATRVF
jgi:hypothetical protein